MSGPIVSPNQAIAFSINEIKGCAQINTAWNMINMVSVRMAKPSTGCKKILSKKAVLASPLSFLKLPV